jgi:hypothetical protein
MRTTIDIDENILRELKRLAAESGTSLRAIVEDILRAGLARRRSLVRETVSEPVITYGGNGPQPGVNLDSHRDLLDLMEGRS